MSERGSERSVAECASERTSAAERTNERASGLFFTAPFQTDLELELFFPSVFIDLFCVLKMMKNK